MKMRPFEFSFRWDLAKNLSHGTQTDIIVTNFSKAFDKVPHRRLLHKLDYYGVRGKTKNWISSFLSNRSQLVVVEGETSDPIDVDSGVPQGSILGPILFLIYVNDLPDNLTSQTRLFADDCIIFRPINKYFILKKKCVHIIYIKLL